MTTVTPAAASPPAMYSGADLAGGLAALGLGRGDTVMVHASLRSLGRVVGGGIALLAALREVVGEWSGTVLVPSFTTYLVDPQMWYQHPAPPELWAMIRASTPPYDPDQHACQRSLGHFPEVVRSAPGSVRSGHPMYSFTALGARAEEIARDQPLDFGLGKKGPLRRFCAAGGKVVMLGVGWDKCTLLHLAEHEAPYRGRRTYDVRLPTGRQAGITTWETTRQLVMHEGDYGQLGEYLEPILAHQGRFRRGPVGAGQAMVAEGEATVREARRWFVRHRDLSAASLLEPYPGVSWEGIGSL